MSLKKEDVQLNWKKYRHLKETLRENLEETLEETDLYKSESKPLDLKVKGETRVDGNNYAEETVKQINAVFGLNEDSFKSEQSDKSDSKEPSKRNPKCARCANHEPNPVPVKGMSICLLLIC